MTDSGHHGVSGVSLSTFITSPCILQIMTNSTKDLDTKAQADDASATTAQPRTSPLEILELLALVLGYLPSPQLAVTCQVSRLFHSVGIPELWHTVVLVGEEADEIWHHDKGFRMGLMRYGAFVERLFLVDTYVQDGDMELIAENCTRLKYLDLTRTNVTADTLRVLIHSDPYNTLSQSGKKRTRTQATSRKGKRQAGVEGEGWEEGEDDDNSEMEEVSNANEWMLRYRYLTETETEYETDYHPLESTSVPPDSATESEQEQPGQPPLVTGPVLPHQANTRPQPRRFPMQPISSLATPARRRAGTTRPNKFKGTKTQFPFYLEKLALNRCTKMTGKACLAVVSLLGPQLKALSLNHITDLEDKDLIQALKHCSNLSSIGLKGSEITDIFLKAVAAQEGLLTGLETLDVNMTAVTDDGLVPLIRACRSTLQSLHCDDNHNVTNKILLAFVEDPAAVKVHAEKLPAIKRAPAQIPALQTLPNRVLKEIQMENCSKVTDEGFEALFKHASELEKVMLNECRVGDKALMALAQSYRERMERLGYGIPSAWLEHERGVRNEGDILKDLNIKSVASRGRGGSTASERGRGRGKVKVAAAKNNEQGKEDVEAETKGLSNTSTSTFYEATRKVFAGGPVEGGLQFLSLKNCPNVSNKGMRTIVRSCVGLRELNVAGNQRVTLELFRGPWASLRLQDLNLQGTKLNVMTVAAKTIGTDLLEERIEEARCPLAPLAPFNQKEDGRNDMDYEDHIVIDLMRAAPIGAARARKELPGQKLTLREFWSKLGKMPHLMKLDISGGDYRIRLKDGLGLTVPALQQNLLSWSIMRYRGYYMGNAELAWFGKHFGYGFDFTADEGLLKRQRQQIKDGTAKKVACLQELNVYDYVLEGIDPDIYEWVLEQDMGLEMADDFDYGWPDEGDNGGFL
ncbi:hypothetical protein EDD11_003926 [Mortierella claussenii]|nr:hypothetical protein EDD11_003926 [Mortierella claussenii]